MEGSAPPELRQAGANDAGPRAKQRRASCTFSGRHWYHINGYPPIVSQKTHHAQPCGWPKTKCSTTYEGALARAARAPPNQLRYCGGDQLLKLVGMPQPARSDARRFALFGHCCGQIRIYGQRRALVVDMFLARHFDSPQRMSVAGRNLHLERSEAAWGAVTAHSRTCRVANICQRQPQLCPRPVPLFTQGYNTVVRTHLEKVSWY